MPKDDMETATMNVMFDGSEEKDDNEDDIYNTFDNSGRADSNVSRRALGTIKSFNIIKLDRDK
jgi:hypothetical protein